MPDESDESSPPAAIKRDRALAAAAIVAVGAIVGAVAGALLASNNSAVLNIVGGPQPSAVTVTLPAETVTISPTHSESVSSTPSQSSAAGQTLREGTLSLSLGYCADLDSVLPNWNVVNDCPTAGALGGDADIRYLFRDQVVEYLSLDDADGAPIVASQPGTFQTCQAATNFATSIPVQMVSAGARFCVRTSAHNYSLLEVTSTDASAAEPYSFNTVDFNVTVWHS